MAPTNSDFSDDSNDPVHVECQYDENTPPSIAIVRAIAVIEDVDPMNSPKVLGITLFDHVNPEALDRLVSATDDERSITVDLTVHNDHQYAVEIRNTGHLVGEKIG